MSYVFLTTPEPAFTAPTTVWNHTEDAVTANATKTATESGWKSVTTATLPTTIRTVRTARLLYAKYATEHAKYKTVFLDTAATA